MLKKFKKQLKKMGYNVTVINSGNGLIINNMVVESDINYLYFHPVNGIINHGFWFFESLNFKQLKMYVDNMFWDIENGLINNLF